MATGKTWKVEASFIAKRTNNPIRSIVENINMEPNPEKCVIALSIGEISHFLFLDLR